MTRRVVVLAICEVLLVAGGLWTIGHQAVPSANPSLALFAGYTAVLTGLTLLPRLYVEHKRHATWITPADCALLVGLFALGPLEFLAAGLLAEIAIAARLRGSALKTISNLVHTLGGFVAAATVFALLGQTDPLDPIAWLSGAAALVACALWDLLSTSAVLGTVEQQPFSSMLQRLWPPVLFSLALSIVLGLVALILFAESPFGVLLFAPILGVLLMSTRSVSHQRAERMHFQQLYEASSKLAHLLSLADTLRIVATEARTLVTGASAICCTVLPDGSWTGVHIDDDGVREASALTVAHLTALQVNGNQGELTPRAFQREARQNLPPFHSMVWAADQGHPARTVVLAVFRDLPTDEQNQHRSDVLTAFVAHAATVVANVALHEEVQEALGRQVELNRQKSEFVAAVSHELRTPLAAMIGSVQTMKRLGDRMPQDHRTRLLEMGTSQGARLQSLIEDLLLVAANDHKEVTFARSPIVVADLICDLTVEFAQLVGDRLVVRVEDGTGIVSGDTDKLRRIVVNLVENARKYATEGLIEVKAHRDGAQVVIAVEDQGPGIPPEDRERVFERFVQLDQSSTRRQGGTGLGLHLCRQLAELHDGTLTLDDAPSGGARFRLVLPALHPGAVTEVPDEHRQASHSSSARTQPVTATPGIAMKRPPGIAMKRPPGIAMKRPPGIAPPPAVVPADGSGPTPTTFDERTAR